LIDDAKNLFKKKLSFLISPHKKISHKTITQVDSISRLIIEDDEVLGLSSKGLQTNWFTT